MKTYILLLTFLLLINNSFSQRVDIISIRDLIKLNKIPGKIYDSKKIILVLDKEGKAEDFLIDSIFNLRLLNSNKASFYILFNEVASDIKYGYAEMTFQPYTSKMILLNDNIDSVNYSSPKNQFKQIIYTKTNVKYGLLTRINYQIKSYIRNQQNKLFDYSILKKNEVHE